MNSLEGTTTYSKRIAIPKNQSKKDDEYSYDYPGSYDLKKNCFNPDKHSPPNPWRSRLMERIETYCESRSSFNFKIV
jgi:hypothetical protein